MAELNGEPLHVLPVGDNEAPSEVVIRSMRDQQVAKTIHPVADGEQAPGSLFMRGAYADWIKNPRPDFVLPDLRLLRVDGLEVLKTIKTFPSLLRVPAVLLTSSDTASDSAKSSDHHANSYVVKTLDFKPFTKLVKDLGFYRLGWNAKPQAD